MKILAIETSCDETAIAIIEARGNKAPLFRIGSNIVSSQVAVHRPWGGVVPNLAKREHQKNLVPVLKKALANARESPISNLPSRARLAGGGKSQNHNSNLKTLKTIFRREEFLFEKLRPFLEKHKKPKIDAIAVTVGPGLEPALWVGANFARALACWWNLPIIPVNHVEAHIIANWLEPIGSSSKVKNKNAKLSPFGRSPVGRQFKIKNLFPALCLVVIGGHTQLILMRNFGKYTLIGETRDDAAGECFDKAAKILGLGYPGGPVIAAEAAKLQASNSKFQVQLPRPMIYTKDYDFSFSGLKTAVLYNFRGQPIKIRRSKKYIQTMCAEIQQAIIDVLIRKTLRAAQEYKVKTIMLGGGVVANEELRKQFAQAIEKSSPATRYQLPDIKYCTDNAAMVGAAAYFHLNKKTPWQKLKAKANLRIAV